MMGFVQLIRDSIRRLAEWVKHLAADRARLARLGSYAALAALLAILGVASSAYRSRSAAQPEQTLPPQSALALKTASPTPLPTAEPPAWAMPLDGDIVGDFEPETPVWSATLKQWQVHPALDIAGMPGEAVYACRDGVISEAWRDRLWGNVIVIDHGDGWQSSYAGLNTLNLVSEGDAVSAGDVISAVGASIPCEEALPAHIHFSLTHDGEATDIRAAMERQE